MKCVRASAVVLFLGMCGCGASTPAELLEACASAGPFTLSKFQQPDATVDCQVASGVTVIAIPRATDAATLRAADVPEPMAELLGVQAGESERADAFCVDAGHDPSDPELVSRAMCGLVNFTIPRVMLIEGNVRMRFVAVPSDRPRLEEVTRR